MYIRQNCRVKTQIVEKEMGLVRKNKENGSCQGMPFQRFRPGTVIPIWEASLAAK